MINKISKIELMNILTQNSTNKHQIGLDSFHEGILIMAKYIGTVPVTPAKKEYDYHGQLLTTTTAVNLLAHNITTEDAEQLRALGFFIYKDDDCYQELIGYGL